MNRQNDKGGLQFGAHCSHPRYLPTSVRATSINDKTRTRTRETTKHKTDQEDGAAGQ